jgi:uncharacterized protein with FMN-binding domain
VSKITLDKKVIVKTIAGISISLILCSCSSNDTEVEQSTTNSNASVSTSGSESKVRKEIVYKDGEYKATGKYGSLPSSITVTVSLEDNVITNVKVTPHATNTTSLDLQERFADAVPNVVVGKRIDDVKVGRLAGSSGTPDGFNNAIQQIKEQATESGNTSE